MKISAARIEKLPNDKRIWHYTSPEVLWKLLSGEFYATHYRFMNDSAEIIYGTERFANFLETVESLKYLSFVIQELRVQDYFLLCFSEDSDNLYHWRSYASKGGFSIGFSYNKMCDLLNKQEIDEAEGKILNYDLVQCQYPEDKTPDSFMHKEMEVFESIMEKWSPEERLFLGQSFAEVKAGRCPDIAAFFRERSPDFCDSFLKVIFGTERIRSRCPAFKDPSFAVEKEYRLVITGEDLRSQVELIGNKPRIKIPIPELSQCIEEVCVSPHGDVEQNHLLAEIARERFGLDFEIYRSKSTFNGK